MANAWLKKLWEAANGSAGMARRQVSDVMEQSSERELIKEAKDQGFHVAKIGDQYFVFQDAINVKC